MGTGTLDLRSSLDIPQIFEGAWLLMSVEGAKLDKVSNDAPALTRALALLPAGGGTIVIDGPGIYLGTAVGPVTKPSVKIEGLGGTGESLGLGNPVGATEILVADGITGITFGDGVTHYRRGPIFRDLVFRAKNSPAAASTIGLKLFGVSQARVDNVNFVGFNGTGCKGYWSKGVSSANPNQHHSFTSNSSADCLIAYDIEDSVAFTWTGAGHIRGNDTGTTRRAGSIGIWVHSTTAGACGQNKIGVGPNLQYWETAVYWEDGEDNEWVSARSEGNDLHVRIGADTNQSRVFGGSMSNSVIGGTGTGIQIDNGAARPVIILPYITSVTNRIVNNAAAGEAEPYIFDLPSDGNVLQLPTVSGVGRISMGALGDIIVGSGSPEGVITAPVSSLFLRSNGSSGTAIYTKDSGAGNTGWKRLGESMATQSYSSGAQSYVSNMATATAHEVTLTGDVTLTIGAPTNGIAGMELTVVIVNSSGGALTNTPAWNAAFKLAGAAAPAKPATGESVLMTFLYSGSVWREKSRAVAVA